MSAYVDDGERFVARLGGEYAPGAKKAVKSLELTDRRIYFSTVGASVGSDGKGESMTSSVIDAANVSALTYSYEKPKGGLGLGIFLLSMAAIAGIVLGVIGYVGDETKSLVKLLLPIGVGVGIGILACVLCYVITYLVRKKRRAVTVSVEYRGLILRTDFYGVKNEKLEEFRRWVFRVKDKLLGRSAPPLPDKATKPDFGDDIAEIVNQSRESKAEEETAKESKEARKEAKKEAKEAKREAKEALKEALKEAKREAKATTETNKKADETANVKTEEVVHVEAERVEKK